MNKWYGLLIGGGALSTAIAYYFMSQKGPELVNAASDLETFRARLPARLARWADYMHASGLKYGVSPWLLAGIMERESNGGDALKPKGDPGGTGDFFSRKGTGAGWKYADPRTGLPPDGKGWGRGLMQIDYGVNYDWITKNAWWDPRVNIDWSANRISENMLYFQRSPGAPIKIDSWRVYTGIVRDGKVLVQPWSTKYGMTSTGPFPDPRPLTGAKLVEASLAAYNAGVGGVLQAVAAGLPAQAATTGQDYNDWMQSRINSWKGA